MKSGKQRKFEIKERRKKRALAKQIINRYSKLKFMPGLGFIAADHNALRHANTCQPLPIFYIDKCYLCKRCGSEEIWIAKQQKWWYETAKGCIHTIEVHCRSCRKDILEEKHQQKKHMRKMAEKVPHPHERFFKRKCY